MENYSHITNKLEKWMMPKAGIRKNMGRIIKKLAIVMSVILPGSILLIIFPGYAATPEHDTADRIYVFGNKVDPDKVCNGSSDMIIVESNAILDLSILLMHLRRRLRESTLPRQALFTMK